MDDKRLEDATEDEQRAAAEADTHSRWNQPMDDEIDLSTPEGKAEWETYQKFLDEISNDGE
jgi:hypothetical protein